MPWAPSDASTHTKAANSNRLKGMWADIANSSLKKHGDEGRAIRAANAAVKRAAEKSNG